MKNIKFLLLAMLCSFVVAGCSDDDDVQQTLSVVSADVYADAVGGNGVIKVESTSTVTAKSSHEEWCSVKVSGNTVTWTMVANPELASRTASITIASAGESTHVTVTQQGAIIKTGTDYVYFEDLGGNGTVSVVATTGYTVSKSADQWFSYTLEDDVILITAEANRSFSTRTGEIYIDREGGPRVTVKLEQQERMPVYEDLLGDWSMYYYDLQGDPQATTVTFSQNVANASYRMSGLMGPFVVNYTSATKGLAMTLPQYLGISGTYYVHVAHASTTGYVMTSSITRNAPMVTVNNGTRVVYEFEDFMNGTTPYDGFRFVGANSTVLNNDSYKVNFTNQVYYKVQLVKDIQ